MTTRKPIRKTCDFSYYGFKGKCYFDDMPDMYGLTSYEHKDGYSITLILSNTMGLDLAKSTLLHELFECAVELARCSYVASNLNNTNKFFQFGHNELDMICEEVYSAYSILSPFVDGVLKKGRKK